MCHRNNTVGNIMNMISHKSMDYFREWLFSTLSHVTKAETFVTKSEIIYEAI